MLLGPTCSGPTSQVCHQNSHQPAQQRAGVPLFGLTYRTCTQRPLSVHARQALSLRRTAASCQLKDPTPLPTRALGPKPTLQLQKCPPPPRTQNAPHPQNLDTHETVLPVRDPERRGRTLAPHACSAPHPVQPCTQRLPDGIHAPGNRVKRPASFPALPISPALPAILNASTSICTHQHMQNICKPGTHTVNAGQPALRSCRPRALS